MKIIKIIIAHLSIFLLTSSIYAQNQNSQPRNSYNSNTKTMQRNIGTSPGANSTWTCTTNASSASNNQETQADQQMANNPKRFLQSAGFAFQHCRDCTKITCSKQ